MKPCSKHKNRGIKLDSKNWTRENIAWLAGLLEGEGCWYARPNCRAAVLSCAMTDLDVLEHAMEIAGDGKIYKKKKTKPQHKDLYQYTIATQTAIYALSCAVYQFMGKRRKKQIRKVLVNMGFILDEREYFINSLS